MFYYTDEFNVSWLPTLRAIWGSKGQQIRIPTPRQPYKRCGLGAVNYHTGETVVIFRQRKRRQEVAELLQAAQHFFDRYNQMPQHVLSIIGALPS